MRIEAQISTMKLYNGRTSVYANLTLGKRTWWISRWDTRQVQTKANEITIARGQEMTWYAGLRIL